MVCIDARRSSEQRAKTPEYRREQYEYSAAECDYRGKEQKKETAVADDISSRREARREYH